MVADRIRDLREANKLTQAELARKLNITRSSVNAWELGVSLPSTGYLIELSKIFKVSTDYLLDLNVNNTIDVSDLNDQEITLIYRMIKYFQSLRTN